MRNVLVSAFLLLINGLNAFSINPNHKFLTKLNAPIIKSENIFIYTWTVNEIKDINRIKKIGVDAIITDYPERVK